MARISSIFGLTWLVTTGAQAPAGEAPDERQATLWGFARTLAIEHPELAPVCVDLDPVGGPDAVLHIAEVLTAGTTQDQMVLRGGSSATFSMIPACMAWTGRKCACATASCSRTPLRVAT